MTKEEKAPYEQKAKEWKLRHKGQERSRRMDCTGQLIDVRQLYPHEIYPIVCGCYYSFGLMLLCSVCQPLQHRSYKYVCMSFVRLGHHNW